MSYLPRFMRPHQRRSGAPFDGYSLSEHDVIVSAYPKSGQTWTLQIVHQLAWHGRGEFGHILDVVPWPDGPPGLSIPLSDPSPWINSPSGLRAIKTHMGWRSIPYSPSARYIAVIRDPKEAFVSQYLSMKRGPFGPASPSLESMLARLLRDTRGMRSWAHIAADYWRQRELANVLILSYKSMKAQPSQVARALSLFLGIRLSDEDLAIVIAKSSFEYMRKCDDKFNAHQLLPLGRRDVMVRSGLSGNSGELLTHEQQQQIDHHFINQLRALGSEFPYAEFCDVTV